MRKLTFRDTLYLHILLSLLERSSPDGKIHLSSKKLGGILNVSQQTADRYLIELEKNNFIERSYRGGLPEIKLTHKALELIQEYHTRIVNVLMSIERIDFEGIVFTGYGEGRYYIQKPKYLAQFIKLLGFRPYPGTLNLRITSSDGLLRYLEVLGSPPIIVKGFQEGGRSFGDVLCYPVLIENRIRGAIVRSLRTHYDLHIVEIISPHYLREVLSLKDGDIVRVTYRKLA